MFCPNDVSLTNSEIMSLVSSINGKPKVARAENKAAAILALNKAMTARIGRDPSQSEVTAVLGEGNFVAAHKALGEMIARMENDAETDHDMAELMRPDETETEPQENNMQDTQISDSKVPSSASTENPVQTPAEGANSAPGAAGAGRKGRKPDKSGKRLHAVAGVTPRRAGSHGERSMKIIADNPGLTTEEFVAKGGRLVDLRWDINNGRVEARDA